MGAKFSGVLASGVMVTGALIMCCAMFVGAMVSDWYGEWVIR